MVATPKSAARLPASPAVSSVPSILGTSPLSGSFPLRQPSSVNSVSHVPGSVEHQGVMPPSLVGFVTSELASERRRSLRADTVDGQSERAEPREEMFGCARLCLCAAAHLARRVQCIAPIGCACLTAALRLELSIGRMRDQRRECLLRWEDDEMFAPAPPVAKEPPSRVLPLFDLAQIAAADLITLRNVLPLLSWADMARANLVKAVCLQVRCTHSCPLLARGAKAACPLLDVLWGLLLPVRGFG